MTFKASNAMNTQRDSPSLVIRKMRTKTARLGEMNSIHGTSAGEGLMKGHSSALLVSVQTDEISFRRYFDNIYQKHKMHLL